MGGDLEDNVSFGPGGRLGVYAGGESSRWRGHLFGEVTRFALGDTMTWYRGGVAGRFAISRNTAFIAEWTATRSYRETWFEGVVSLGLYF